MNNPSENIDVNLMSGPVDHGVGFIDEMNKLRDLDPVHWSEKSHCWIVSNFEDVTAGFNGEVPIGNAGRNEFSLMSIPLEDRPARIPNLHKYVKDWIVAMDGPEHYRVRKLIMRAFNKKLVEKIRPMAKERVQVLLNKAEASKERIEFNEEIARPLPGFVIFKLLGLPDEHSESLRDWSNAVVEGMTASAPSPEKLEKTDWALGEMNRAVLAVLDERKKEPREDLLTAMLQATEDGETLTIDELLGTMHVAIVAGHDTTSNTMTLGLEALSRHPEAWQYMYENPDKMLDCVTELMRYIAMSGGQPRIAQADFEWHGKQIKQGDIVFLSIMGANRDGSKFDNPETLDFSRDNADSQVFGPGIHHCLGHLLAKMQLCEFFEALVNRFESVEILDERLDFMPTAVFRGMYGMNVRFHSRENA
jgi:cytochrome P450